MDIIVSEGLTKNYGSRRAIERLDLRVPAASVFGFLGPNGAGKTTTIRILLGFLRPTAGRARIFDLDCLRRSHHIKRDVGYLPGDLRLYPWMNGRSALRVLGAIRGRDLLGHGSELAERLRLDLQLHVRRMSQGMRQKLGLILTLAHRPRLLVLDEPSAGLDPLMQQELQVILRERARQGCTVFFSSHSLAEVENVCDRIAILRQGRLVADEELATMRERARRDVILRFRSATAARELEPPPCLEILERHSRSWHGRVDGFAMDLVGWAGDKPIEDLSIAEPDLESLFQSYYREEGP